MRADRLLSIIWLLRAHGGLSTVELAERLEVSRRTILRDVEALSAAGVPVYCERGPNGGVRLLPDYRTDVTALSSEESRALFAGVTAWGADSLGLGDALASGLRKLLAAVPETYRDQSATVAERIVIDPQGWLPQPEQEQNGDTFRIVQNAVFAQRRLQIEYRHKTRSSTRVAVVEPHGLVSATRSWYLCATTEGELGFTKVSRIDRAEMLPEPCSGDTVGVAAEWRAQRERFLDGFTAVTATAWVRDTRWSDAHEWVIRAGEREPTSPPPDPDGWSFLELEFVDHLHAMTILLRLGPDARIVSPITLRDDFTAYLSTTLERYAG
ncbi:MULTISPECIES: YafY family protein [unclassified Actinomyces]|uniref:helix-turn-helix transcriptional regulator n=1 Tax=unclassified Actinomyces TaxID=2609248 RepID=UPI0020179D21|nr:MULTISPECIES: YafY family protein [unclassified Actinomyces]MCL3776631.1 YafY family transcriptional regulator [Actinomyces sp. AC-20-1]MCL3790277.1 YafY family transcriptional regulator [Actinomyces sp. 187325]MCL3795069.1 YafY family transcriptional regulator [Actinomyces sp. 217892]